MRLGVVVSSQRSSNGGTWQSWRDEGHEEIKVTCKKEDPAAKLGNDGWMEGSAGYMQMQLLF